MPVFGDNRGRAVQIQRRNLMLDATIRDFSGGWNVIDNDLNLDTKYAKILENMQRGSDGSNSVRPGTELFAETSDYLDKIINCFYFSGYIVAVGLNGKIVRVSDDGSVTLIWDANFASSLDGSPDPWVTTPFASATIFNGELIVANGINKPLIINSSVNVTYLHDPATGSNANTPIARFVLTHGRYLVMAGSVAIGEEDKLFISGTDTSGVFLNDPTTDAVNLSLGSRVPSGSHDIKGLGRFRDKLMVLFEDVILPGTIGTFTDPVYDSNGLLVVGAVHNPTFSDSIENAGGLSHRTQQTIGKDMLYAGHSGISSIRRATLSTTINETEVSELINPAYQKDIGILSSTIAQEDRTWSLWDNNSDNYMLFIPNANEVDDTTETKCFVFKKNEKLGIAAWQQWRNWNFASGCVSALKRVFLTEGSQIFVMGSDPNHTLDRDYYGDQEMWTDGTPWEDYTGWNPVSNSKDSGVPIKFVWELPWSDHDQRFITKNSRYINFDTVGKSRFNVDMFIDNLYFDRTNFGEDWQEDNLKWDDSLGWDVDALAPALSMQMAGGDNQGFGGTGYGNYYGAGRPTSLEQLYSWVAKYKIQKLRISGDSDEGLSFVSITLGYLNGSPRR
jgi:hypothetical protein